MNGITVAQPITRTRQLTVEELKTIAFPIKLQSNLIIIDQGLLGHKLKTPVALKLEKVLAVNEKGLINYILTSFVSERPALIPFVFDNESLIKMARHFLRHCSGSYNSCCNYTAQLQRYANWLGHSPDAIIQDVKPGLIPDPERLQNHTKFLNDYLAALQDDGMKPGPVSNYIKAVKTFYRVNGVKIEQTEPLSRRVTYKDRAPTTEEVAKLIDVGNLRERVIVSLTATGGFREGTLSKLKYLHIKEDFEANRIPLHIHVEAEITKGKYGDYDTFLGPEAVTYLRLYIDARRRGTSYLPPEEITDDTPIIRDESTAKRIKGITGKQIRKIVHALYQAAGLLKKTLGRLYDLREHSIRKFFKTQLIALGVQSDYVDYMMGHVVDTYNDIQSKGIEFLRNIYNAAGLAIKAKLKVSKIDALKEIIRAWGMNPEQLLTRNALAEGATTKQEDVTDQQLAVLGQELKRLIKSEATV
jgi:site-specific recombinase XerD